MRFEGFPEAAFMFYEGLEADNSKSYWNDHRAVYEECVKAPLGALLAELEAEFGAPKLFRPYRDVRFSKDKSPYKTQAGASAAGRDGNAGGYLHLSAEGLFVAGGYYQTAPDQVERLRAAIADDGRGGELQAILGTARRAGFTPSGDELKTVPRGYPADHPRADLLRYKSLVLWRQWPPEPWLHTRDALNRIRRAWRALGPLHGWLDHNVGASDRPG